MRGSTAAWGQWAPGGRRGEARVYSSQRGPSLSCYRLRSRTPRIPRQHSPVSAGGRGKYEEVSIVTLVLREPTGDDAPELGRIVFDAFGAIAEQHRFPPDFPAPEMAAGLLGGLLEHPGFYGIVAELDGRVVGRWLRPPSSTRSISWAATRSLAGRSRP